MCGILETTNVASQSVEAGGNIVFATNKIGPSCVIRHTAGSDTVTLPAKGVYEITFNADINPTAGGVFGIDIQNNATDVVSANFTATAATVEHITMNTLVDVPASCPMVNNGGNITILCGSACAVTDADLIIKKVR